MFTPCRAPYNEAMATRGETRRKRLGDYLAQTGWTAIGEGEFRKIAADLAPIPEHDLRRLLRETGLPLAPLVEGVRQGSLEELERTLRALADEYRGAAAQRAGFRATHRRSRAG